MTRLHKPARDRSVRSALFAVALFAAALCGIEIAMLSEAALPLSVVGLFPAVGVAYVLVGCLAWDRRPSNRTGALLVLGGFSVLAASLSNAPVASLAVVGAICATVPLAVVVHLLLAFPTGVVRGGRRVLVLAGYLVALPLQAPAYLFGAAGETYSMLTLAERPGLVHLGTDLQTVAGSALLLASAGVVLRRVLRYDRARRLVLGSLLGYTLLAVAWAPFAQNVARPGLGLSPVAVYVSQVLVLGGIPVVMAAGVLRGGFARMRDVEDLQAWLGSDRRQRPDLRAVVAQALGDPSLLLWFWSEEAGSYVDRHGNVVDVHPAGPGGQDRGRLAIGGGDLRVGLIEYDALLLADPDPVAAAGRVISLEMEREQLTAELLVQRAALRASRRRLVAAGDRARRTIAQDLHDGAQGRLVVIGMALADLAQHRLEPAVSQPLAAVRRDIDSLADELRRLVHGLMPPLLIERGLPAAIEDLTDRVSIPVRLTLPPSETRLAAPVEAAGYFCVSEAVTNILKHAHARQASVAVRICGTQLVIEVEDDGIGGADPGSGLGLPGIADRIDVLGGRLTVHSPPGQGTRLLMEMPCGS